MEYYASYWAPTNSLSHHGVLGMKWGVRRYQNKDGSLTPKGKKRYSRFFSSKDTYERIKSIRNDEKRMGRMSNRQKKSLDNAEKYWEARSQGKIPEVHRGIIKRLADRSRSYSAKERFVGTTINNVLISSGRTAINSIAMGDPILMSNAKAIALRSLSSSAESMLIDELWTNVIFGHF